MYNMVAFKDIGYAEWCFNFACSVGDIGGSDIERLQEAVILSGNPKWCFRFAVYVIRADMYRLQEVVIASGDAKWCYWFARLVKGSDIYRLGKVVYASSKFDPYWYEQFKFYLYGGCG